MPENQRDKDRRLLSDLREESSAEVWEPVLDPTILTFVKDLRWIGKGKEHNRESRLVRILKQRHTEPETPDKMILAIWEFEQENFAKLHKALPEEERTRRQLARRDVRKYRVKESRARRKALLLFMSGIPLAVIATRCAPLTLDEVRAHLKVTNLPCFKCGQFIVGNNTMVTLNDTTIPMCRNCRLIHEIEKYDKWLYDHLVPREKKAPRTQRPRQTRLKKVWNTSPEEDAQLKAEIAQYETATSAEEAPEIIKVPPKQDSTTPRYLAAYNLDLDKIEKDLREKPDNKKEG